MLGIHCVYRVLPTSSSGCSIYSGAEGGGGGGWCGGERCECRFDVGVMMAEVWCPIDLFDFLLLHYLVRP